MPFFLGMLAVAPRQWSGRHCSRVIMPPSFQIRQWKDWGFTDVHHVTTRHHVPHVSSRVHLARAGIYWLVVVRRVLLRWTQGWVSCSVGNRDLELDPVKVSRHLCVWKLVWELLACDLVQRGGKEGGGSAHNLQEKECRNIMKRIENDRQ